MEVKVRLGNLRIAPRKVRQVADLVRGKNVPQAQALLLFTVNKPARSVLKLINSAVATAKHEFHLEDESALFVTSICIDEGIKLKRWHPMSRGRAFPIIKRSSHIALVLSDKNPKTKEVKVEKTVEPEKVKEVKEAKKEIKEVKKAVKKETKPKTIKKK